MGKKYKVVEETWSFEGFSDDEIKSLNVSSGPININCAGKNRTVDKAKMEADAKKAAEEAAKKKAADKLKKQQKKPRKSKKRQKQPRRRKKRPRKSLQRYVQLLSDLEPIPHIPPD